MRLLALACIIMAVPAHVLSVTAFARLSATGEGFTLLPVLLLAASFMAAAFAGAVFIKLLSPQP